MSDATQTDEPQPRTPSIVVTGGGEVDAATLAALTVALTPMGSGDDAPAERATHRIGGWAHAAIIEGIGGRPPTSHPDVVQGRFGLGHVGHPA